MSKKDIAALRTGFQDAKDRNVKEIAQLKQDIRAELQKPKSDRDTDNITRWTLQVDTLNAQNSILDIQIADPSGWLNYPAYMEAKKTYVYILRSSAAWAPSDQDSASGLVIPPFILFFC